MSRYDRQIRIEGWKQEKLRKAKILIAGAGALGSALANELARLGVGELKLVDYDRVELSNLNRQLFDEEDIGKYKVEALKEKLEKINREVKIETLAGRVETVDVKKYSLVADCLDNLSSRLSLNERCIRNKVKLVSIGIWGFYGQLQVVIPYETPCLNCNEIITHGKVLGDSCNEGKNPAVISLSYVMAGMGANEIIKILMWKKYTKEFVFYDGLKNELRKIGIRRKRYCRVCGKNI